MARHIFLKLVVLWSSCAAHSVLTRNAQAAERPNILLLLSDDHSYPFLSCYGDGNVKTPTLDRLAAEGMKFHRYFTAAPQCVPSRAALMTGRSPVAARMTRFSSPLPRDEVTFLELLREHGGYFTGVCGRSYHLDGPGNRGGEGIAVLVCRPVPPLDGPGNRGGEGMAQLLQKHQLRTFAERVDFLNTCPDAEVTKAVSEFLDKRPAAKPFFLWANFSDPHYVWNLNATYFTTPRPVYELYDLQTDPSELNNISGRPELATVERELRMALAEKMILDFDYLPLPDLQDGQRPVAGAGQATKNKKRKSNP